MPAIKAVIDATALFPSAMMDDMLASYLSGESEEIWLTTGEPNAKSVAYSSPERMTSGTWNMLLIAVHPEHQGKGVGVALVKHTEEVLRMRGARLLLVETSSLPEYEKTRRFYYTLGYREEGRIREFYQQGEDKIIFRKALG